MTQEMMNALVNAHNVAMHNALAARIPECGDFAEIAQNLAWLLDEMERQSAAASPACRHDQQTARGTCLDCGADTLGTVHYRGEG